MPAGDEPVKLGRIGGRLDALAQRPVAQQLRDFRKDFQVLLRGGLRHEQEDEQAHGLLVGGVEADGMRQLENGRHGRLQALDASVGNRDAMAQTGRAQAFPGEKAVGDERAREAMLALEQQPRLLKSTLFAGGIDAHEHLSGRQYGS